MDDALPTEAEVATRDSLLASLGRDSYTAHRLQHAQPEHLHLTTRRCFIGPIPEGWLKDHRRDWYKRHLHIHYSSRAATFSAGPNVGKQRRLSGLDVPSAAATYGHSFPQPEDVEDEQIEESASNEMFQEATLEAPPAIPIPRTVDGGEDALSEDTRPTESEQPAFKQITVHKSKNTLEPPSTVRSNRATGKRSKSTQSSTASFKTAPESFRNQSTGKLTTVNSQADNIHIASQAGEDHPLDGQRDSFATIEPAKTEPAQEESSTTSLISHGNAQANDARTETMGSSSGGILSRMKSKAKEIMSDPEPDGSAPAVVDQGKRVTSGLVRFNVPDNTTEDGQQGKISLGLKKRETIRRMRKQKVKDGQAIKVEKMLVRVDFTTNELSRDFDENDSEKIEARTLEKWREYIVVCREVADENVEFSLQLYKTRVIAMTERRQKKKKSTHEIPLSRKTARVNLFSSLDKTMVIWEPFKSGSKIYIMKPQSAANSMEWYTFLKNVLGWNRASTLRVNVPDLDVGLLIDKPFDKLESARELAQAAKGNEDAVGKTMKEEQEAAEKIIQRCIGILSKSPEWRDIVGTWAEDLHIGLAWKRYDRLEWIHGVNEKKMYGTIAMEKSHDLELRPKQHYPTITPNLNGEPRSEPAPVEGFLIRLTSQKGTQQRLGKLFYKRLYFSTHNQYLVFNRPAQADPPPPPKLPMQRDSKIPTIQQIIDEIPLIYAVSPFPVKDGEVSWLQQGSALTTEQRKVYDEDAYDENERKINLLLQCDGNVNLCNVVRIRKVKRGATAADENIGEGSDVDFHEDVSDTEQDDGTTESFDDDRTFELVLRNGLVMRLQAYNKKTKKEWIRRLRDLVEYWKLRTTADTSLYQSVRAQNLNNLGIDEETEAFMGQFARKWEVTKSYASPELYNMCGISCCRTIHMSGTLYRKPRIHSTFARSLVILSHGQLLVFQDSLRASSGKMLPHIHHDKVATLDLKDCYIYSGLITESDLLYTNTTFDSNKPGHHALPRMYLEDGWSSTDEDTMTCFVVWHGKRRSWFRSESGMVDERGKRHKLKHLSKLGVTGRSVVFKARSRAERDHWVLSIGVEIERLAQGEEVRLVGED